mgnify:FL=1
MKLTAVLRVKDEILCIKECLSKLSTLTDEIIVLDNGSTDGTLEAIGEFNKVVKIIHTEGYHEGRDMCFLLEEAKKRNPDWILWMDGDEVFEQNFTRSAIDEYMKSKYSKILFKLCHFWLSKEYFRLDSFFFSYTMGPQRSMWRNVPSAYFSSKKMHHGDIRGIIGKTYISPYRIKHFGCIDRKKMREKYERYVAVDDTNERTYKLLNPDAKVVKIKFVEFKNKLTNKIYILIYKYITDLIHQLILIKRFLVRKIL